MTVKTLKPTEMSLLKLISENKEILVSDLVTATDLDRGTIEGGIANLLDKSMIKREVTKNLEYKLTERGLATQNKLPERIILDTLIKKELSMSNLSEATGLGKQDVSAGIGLLRKSGVIAINKGNLEIKDEELAKIISLDLQEILEKISDKQNSINHDKAQILQNRGLIEIIENSQARVTSKITKAQLKKIKVADEVSQLTPHLIASGNWQNVSFKPYSMKTKPRKIYAGRFNPYRNFLDNLRNKLIGLGFQEMKGPLIEQEFWNFDALYAPQDHPAREDSDILLVKQPSHGKLLKKKYVTNVAKTHEDGWKTGSKGHRYKWDPEKAARLLLRPQGTAISARTLGLVKQPPAKYFSMARCFRPDQVDATHDVEFDQTEGIILDPSITFKDLLGMLKIFATEVAGASEVRFRPDYYPFTSPSVELSAKHPVLGYIEFGGAGIFRPEVTQPFGIDYPVLAWGLGVGRLFMTKYDISDIRELFTQNLEWLRDAEVSSSIKVEDN